jgi:acyl-CoA synthetase (AMP-forming)/AMP-acid ligase II
MYRPKKIGSIGLAISGCEVKVVDGDDNEVSPGEVGEIVIRGYNVMKGYYKRPEATEEAFRGGWFHTGDMGTMDEDEYFFIVDRKKDLILRGGFNVYPREVEEVLYSHSSIREAAVIGVPDEKRSRPSFRSRRAARSPSTSCSSSRGSVSRPPNTLGSSKSSTTFPRGRPVKSCANHCVQIETRKKAESASHVPGRPW